VSILAYILQTRLRGLQLTVADTGAIRTGSGRGATIFWSQMPEKIHGREHEL